MVSLEKKAQISDLLKLVHFLDEFETDLEKVKKKLRPAAYKKLRAELGAAHRRIKSALEEI